MNRRALLARVPASILAALAMGRRRAVAAQDRSFPVLGMPVWNPTAEPPLTHEDTLMLVASLLGPPTITRTTAGGSVHEWRAVSLPVYTLGGGG